MYEIIIGRPESDKKRFGTKGTIFLGKHFVKMGQTSSLASDILLDVNRSHVVFVCGKRGCVTGDTLIFTDKGYKPIEEFNEQEDIVLSYDKDRERFVWEKAKLVSYDISKEEELLEFEFEDGQKLVLTQEHPLLVFDKGKSVWKMASKISKDDKVISVYSIPEVKNDKASLRIARLLGFILADGTLQIRKGRFVDGKGYLYNGTKARLRIINANNAILQQAKKDLEKEFSVNARIYKKGNENCFVLESKCQKVVNRFVQLGVPVGKKENIIKIPPIVWESSNRFKKEFLKALFSCDGFVDKNGSRIVYYSNSEMMIKDLNLILAHFGIQSRIRKKKTTCNSKEFISYSLDITDYASVKAFEKHIGFFDEEKMMRVRRRRFHRMKRRKRTLYLNDSLFCQRIKSVKKVKKVVKVYDLMVPKNHSFIANGIISHNSGKSYSLGVIAEGISSLPPEIAKNIAVLIFDTMGIFWTLKYPNVKQRDLLKEWGLEPKAFDPVLYIPLGMFEQAKSQGLPADVPFSLLPSDLSVFDWCHAFGFDPMSNPAVLIDRVVGKLREEKKQFSINDILSVIESDQKADQHIKDLVASNFERAKRWGLFGEKATPIADLVQPGKVSIIDISCYATMPGTWGIRALVIGIVSRRLFMERMAARKLEEYAAIKKTTTFFERKEKRKMPLVWLFLDEAHEFIPREGKTAASDALITILREGRQPGISLVLASQQPGKIHTDVMTQADVVLAHRLTAKIDVDALGLLMQSYLRKGLDKEIDDLPRVKGAAIIFDDTAERLYPMKVRPRMSWHGGASPRALE